MQAATLHILCHQEREGEAREKRVEWFELVKPLGELHCLALLCKYVMHQSVHVLGHCKERQECFSCKVKSKSQQQSLSLAWM